VEGMAKKSKKNKRTKKGGRVTPKGTQPAGGARFSPADTELAGYHRPQSLL